MNRTSISLQCNPGIHMGTTAVAEGNPVSHQCHKCLTQQRLMEAAVYYCDARDVILKQYLPIQSEAKHDSSSPLDNPEHIKFHSKYPNSMGRGPGEDLPFPCWSENWRLLGACRKILIWKEEGQGFLLMPRAPWDLTDSAIAMRWIGILWESEPLTMMCSRAP